MYGYVYLTTNLINGNKYIGQHRASKFEPEKYIGSGKTFIKALNKYGRENFDCILLEECESAKELNDKEIYWIAKYNAVDDSTFYNINKGGLGHSSAPWNKGLKHPQEWTLKMQEAFDKMCHLPASPKLKKFLSEYRKNVKVSDETKEKLSKQQLGRKAINNGIINTYVKEEDLQNYLSNGWVLGLDKSLIRKRN